MDNPLYWLMATSWMGRNRFFIEPFLVKILEVRNENE